MTTSHLIAVSTFRSTADAQIAKGILDEAGIESLIRSDNAGGMYPALAASVKAPLVPFLLAGIADKPEMFQADQLHPTAQGEVRVADNVWAVLGPLLAARK